MVKDVNRKEREDVELQNPLQHITVTVLLPTWSYAWNTDGIDFSKAGTYTVNGTVK